MRHFVLHQQLQSARTETSCAAGQVVQRGKSPVQTETFGNDDKGCAAPSIVLCSFGNYNLTQLELSYETLGGGWYILSHNVTDLAQSRVKNNTKAFQYNPTSETILDLTANYSDASGHTDAYGHTDLITTHNTSGPTLAGIVRSVSSDINITSSTSGYNAGLRNKPWCVMWTFYRYTVPPLSKPARDKLDTSSDADRQFNFTQAYKVTLNLNGGNTGTGQNTVEVPYVWTQVVDFPGSRKEEWRNNSLSSQFLRRVLETGDPAGFTLLTLNNYYAMSVQKQVTTAMPWYQQTGWPFSPWPWSDTSHLQVSHVICHAMPCCGTQHCRTLRYAAMHLMMHLGCLVHICRLVKINITDLGYLVQTINHVITSVTPQSIPSNATHQNLYNGFGFISDHGGPLWSHSITIGILRGSTETLYRTYVPALIGFWGNVGGAYTFMVLLYALFFVLKSPLVETEFSIPGANFARFLYDTTWGGLKKPSYRTLHFSSQRGHVSPQAFATSLSPVPPPPPAATPSPAASPSPASPPSSATSPSAATLSSFAVATPDPRSRHAVSNTAQPTAALPAAGRGYLRQRSGGDNRSLV